MPTSYRVAIIGSTGRGDYGHGIDTVWKEIPQARVVAVADENPDGRAKAADRMGAPAAYADYREMLDKERPQVVSICPRWVDRHAELAIACLERGIHVFMEKPFCRTLDEADRIIRAGEMTHAKLALAHQTRYCPIVPVVQQLIADGKLGTLLEIRGRGKEDSRGGCEDFWVLGSHMLNMMTAFAGQPISCTGAISQKDRPVTKGDVAEGPEGLGPMAGDAVRADYQFPKGVVGYFNSRRNQGGNPARFAIQIFGSKGIVEYPSGYLPPVHFLEDPSWSPGRSQAKWQRVTSAGIDKPEPLTAGTPAGNVVAVNDLLKAIEADRQPLCSAYDGRTVIEMIMGAFESHRLNRPIVLPLAERDHPLTKLS
jgi:predicted dehydrogenase